jgi:uncharacterized membrane protein
MRELITRRASYAVPDEEWKDVERHARRRMFGIVWALVWFGAFLLVSNEVSSLYQPVTAVLIYLVARAPMAMAAEGWRRHLKYVAVEAPALLFFAAIYPRIEPEWPWLVLILVGLVSASILSARRPPTLWPMTVWSVAVVAICTWWTATRL